MTNITLYSVPNTGTHYLMQTLAFLMGSHDLFDEKLYDTIPLYKELSDSDLNKPVIAFQTSALPHAQAQDYLTGRYVLSMYRHPLDVTLSRYFSQVRFQGQDLPFGKYFEQHFLAITDEIFQHFAFIDKIGGLNICYEYCLVRPEEFIAGMASILERDLTPLEVQTAIAAIDIEKAKASERAHGYFPVNNQDGPFYRDGKAFQYQDFFNADLIEEIKASCPASLIESLSYLGYTITAKE